MQSIRCVGRLDGLLLSALHVGPAWRTWGRRARRSSEAGTADTSEAGLTDFNRALAVQRLPIRLHISGSCPRARRMQEGLRRSFPISAGKPTARLISFARLPP